MSTKSTTGRMATRRLSSKISSTHTRQTYTPTAAQSTADTTQSPVVTQSTTVDSQTPASTENAQDTETTDSDVLVMAIHTVSPRPEIAVENQLPRPHECPVSTDATRTRPDKIPTHAVELEFRSGFVTAMLDSQAQKSYISPIIAKKFGTPINGLPTTVRLADGHTKSTVGTAVFATRIGDLEIEFTASILEDLYCEVLLGHDFLVQNEVSWDYAACTIHLGARRRTTACWKGHTTTPTNTAPDLS
uniref:Peptidase A2 domain-containing protein n=1 Tax=Sipha flava TaxID=143950 RepID=A0A2S2PW08_9HEMI